MRRHRLKNTKPMQGHRLKGYGYYKQKLNGAVIELRGEALLANLQDQQCLRKHADQARIMRTSDDHPIGGDVFSWGLTKAKTSSNSLTRKLRQHAQDDELI